ncbi:hypothetical protein P168DRAFT_288663 [Aspergillus campestris IBT 28561]|uniref:Uncharacterized protein n=1 Tax=Aspergillus campestris (strain IBT 28561) TaxID=1392248 RepID=A0A2I1DA72_ASPC2|nr:uncharacterized protein P168DRAFT_288663 [Aspergillus campestris IBT 28561]PKY06761.1 hypothetical protein P168DRAFT_288663 [Aspergillus campestris IBT 28561]
MGFELNYHLGTGKPSTEKRYRVSQVLSDHQVPHVVWFEDALVHYGVPTAVFDLYILVEDIELTAECLAKAGWTFDMHRPHRIGNAEVDLMSLPQQRLISADNHTRTILLPATDWNFSLTDAQLEYADIRPDSASSDNKLPFKVPFPPLAGLLDALIESWLECPSDDTMLSIVLACQISYLYAHVPVLKQQKSFVEQMRYEHRQFHFDVLAGMETGTLPFRRHQRPIRDALRRGEYELRECSAPRDTKELFFPLGRLGSKPVEEEQQDEDTT